MTPDALLESLVDLKHDLGKYLVLPLSLLPKDAGEAAVREALGRALHATRKDRSGTHSARELWQSFERSLPAAAAARPCVQALQRAVERALAWEQPLAQGAPLPRAAVEQDLRAVQGAIAAVIDEVRSG